MQTAKIFNSGNSQALRLPKEYRIDTKEVYIKKEGKKIILIPKDNPWEEFERSLEMFKGNDLFQIRDQKIFEKRDEIK